MIEGTGEALKPGGAPDGIEGPQKVLIVCGVDTTQYLHTAELYDPATGNWTPTGSLFYGRLFLSATTLPNGRVLVAGGGFDSVELYNRSVGQWYATGKLHTRVTNNTATLLADGKVLVAAGLDIGAPPSEFFRRSAELYDPSTQVWTFTGDLNIARFNHTATLLPDGKVLAVGGAAGGLPDPGPTAELFDPVTLRWTLTGSLSSGRSGHTATLLPNGSVLVAGGSGRDNCELYNPSVGQWSATGGLNEARSFSTTTRLPDGKVLILGGMNQDGSVLGSTELYDPVSQVWTTTANLDMPLIYHTATLLPTGKVLVAGGSNSEHIDGASSGAKLYDPATESWTSTGSLNTPRVGHAAALVEFPPVASPTLKGRPISILSILDPRHGHLSF